MHSNVLYPGFKSTVKTGDVYRGDGGRRDGLKYVFRAVICFQQIATNNQLC